MNYALWTVLVIFIPNAIGYIIYFVVRQPVRGACPQCGATVNPAFNFCPKCKFILHPACPECHRAIELGATFCPYCAADLKVPNASGFHAPSF
jgi:RNA polymerase subunit RPABC4/transcription elongation factor Spt4